MSQPFTWWNSADSRTSLQSRCFSSIAAVTVTQGPRWSHLKPSELLSVNLAVTDLGAALSMYPLAVAACWNHAWLGGDATCIYYGLMGFFFGVASIATLTVMAVVRFVVTSTQQSSNWKISKRRVHMLLAGTWLYALLWAAFPLLGWGRYGPEPFGLSCSLAWTDIKDRSPSFIVSIFTMNLALPAILIITCYFGIVLRLYVFYKSMNNGNLIPNAVKVQRRLVVIAILISFGFIGCWTPYGIVSLWSIYSSNASISPQVSMLPCLFAKSSTVYNPLIYYMFSKTFKQEVKELLCITPSSRANNATESRMQVLCDGYKLREDLSVRTVEKGNRIETQFIPLSDP